MAKCQVKEFISETPKGIHETSIKEHLANFAMVRHGNKQTKHENAYNRKKERNRNRQFALFQKVTTETFTENVYTHVCSVMFFIFFCYNKLSYGTDRQYQSATLWHALRI